MKYYKNLRDLRRFPLPPCGVLWGIGEAHEVASPEPLGFPVVNAQLIIMIYKIKSIVKYFLFLYYQHKYHNI